MYPTETRNTFIELRAQGISLERIAQQLNINKSTALDWQRRFKSRIDELKACHFDAIRERLATKYEEELEYSMEQLRRIRAELKTRDWDYEATTFLFHAEAMAWKRVQKLCALAELPDCPPASLESETLPAPEPDPGATAPQKPTVSQPFSHQKLGARTDLQIPASPDGSFRSQPLVNTRPPADNESPQTNPSPENTVSCSSGENPCPVVDALENPTVSPPFSHQKLEGGTNLQIPAGSDSQPPIAKPAADTESPRTAPGPADAVFPANVESAPKLSSLDPDDPNFHDGSIVIAPGESMRSILERYGAKIPNHPDIRFIRS